MNSGITKLHILTFDPPITLCLEGFHLKWLKNSETDVLKLFLRVRYAVSVLSLMYLKMHTCYGRKTRNRNMQMRSKCKFSKLAKIVETHQKLNQHSTNNQNTLISVQINQKMLKN